MQRRENLELVSDIRRSIDEKPMLPIQTDSDTRLRARGNEAGARSLAVLARAIPLRQPAACRGAKNADANSDSGVLAGSLGRVGRALHRDAHFLDLGLDPLLFDFRGFHDRRKS